MQGSASDRHRINPLNFLFSSKLECRRVFPPSSLVLRIRPFLRLRPSFTMLHDSRLDLGIWEHGTDVMGWKRGRMSVAGHSAPLALVADNDGGWRIWLVAVQLLHVRSLRLLTTRKLRKLWMLAEGEAASQWTRLCNLQDFSHLLGDMRCGM